jgi:hypothetical protein
MILKKVSLKVLQFFIANGERFRRRTAGFSPSGKSTADMSYCQQIELSVSVTHKLSGFVAHN